MNAKKYLKELAEDNGIKAIVAQDALDSDSPIDYLEDVTSHGCVSGMVNDLIYYSDTHKFFNDHYNEIEELRQEYEENIGEPLKIGDNLTNWLAWFAYEERAHQILGELGVKAMTKELNFLDHIFEKQIRSNQKMRRQNEH